MASSAVTHGKVRQLKKDKKQGIDKSGIFIASKEYNYLSSLAQPYERSGRASPNMLHATTETEPLMVNGVHYFHAVERQEIDEVFVMDTEGYGARAELLHNGYIYDPESDPENPFKQFRHWVTPTIEDESSNRKPGETRGRKPKGEKAKKYKLDMENMGFQELIVRKALIRYLTAKETGKNQLCLCFGHFAAVYDYGGFAYNAVSNEDVDITYRNVTDVCEVSYDLNFVMTGNRPTQHNKKSSLVPGKGIALPWAKHFYDEKNPKTKFLLHPNVMRHTPVEFRKGSKFKAGMRPRAWVRDPSIAKYLRRGLFDSGSAGDSGVIRIRAFWEDYGLEAPTYFEDGKEKKKKFIIVTFRLMFAGKNPYIEVSAGGNMSRIRLVDSYWHLPAPLAKLGAKGETPLQYTNPEEWFVNEIRAGRVNRNVLNALGSFEEEEAFKVRYWFNHLDKAADDYCKQDCVALYKSLQKYRKLFGDVIRHPETGKPTDPLAYLTVAQVSRTGMALMPGGEGKEMIKEPGKAPRYKHFGLFYREVFEDRNGKKKIRNRMRIVQDDSELAEVSSYAHFMEKPLVRSVRAEANSGSPYKDVLMAGGFYQYGDYNKAWRHITFGGNTTVFKPRNREGTRTVSIDANSMYPSVMADNDLKFPDPRYIRKMKKDVIGRHAILEFLKEKGGMFRIVCGSATNSVFRERFPVFPMRMEGLDMDSRLAFLTWGDDEPLDHYVGREELMYFLENTDIKNENIRIIAEDSYETSLLKAQKTPFYHFINAFYAKRRDALRRIEKARKRAEEARLAGDDVTAKAMDEMRAEAEGDSLILKLIMNAGYGIFIQVNDQNLILTEGDHEGNFRSLSRMLAMSTGWEGWNDMTHVKAYSDLDSVDIIHFCMKWASDHYRSSSNRSIHRDFADTLRRIAISLPSELASHSLRAFGASITGHARVRLHKAITGIDKVRVPKGMTETDIDRFEVLYCDTDSVHFEVPEDMDNETVIKLIEGIRIPGEGGKLVQPIQIGDGLGEWKIERQDPNPNLVTPKVRKHLEEEGISLDVLDAFYMASKHYYLTTKPDSNGKRYMVKEVVKGVPANATMMRCAMLAFSIGMTKLGDPFGLAVDRQMTRDMLTNIRESPSGRRRSYEYSDQMSEPLVLREPVLLNKEATYFDAFDAVQKDLYAQSKGEGFLKAIVEYEQIICRDKPVIELRRELEESFRDVTSGMIDEVNRAGISDVWHQYYELERKLKKAGVLDEVRDDTEVVL